LELRQNYAGATAFVYPSEYEGFGLPILEAMASSTIVVTSNLSSMPEIGGEVAFYFDPYEIESITEGLRQVVNEMSESPLVFPALANSPGSAASSKLLRSWKD
jgi:glycosyltransferase involved in cell wall biosynthesis